MFKKIFDFIKKVVTFIRKNIDIILEGINKLINIFNVIKHSAEILIDIFNKKEPQVNV